MSYFGEMPIGEFIDGVFTVSNAARIILEQYPDPTRMPDNEVTRLSSYREYLREALGDRGIDVPDEYQIEGLITRVNKYFQGRQSG